MKWNLIIVFVIGCLNLFSLSVISVQSQTSSEQKNSFDVEISVKVIGGKPEGTVEGVIDGRRAMLWDVPPFDPPDIVVCISEGNAKPKCTDECSDTYSCVFKHFTISSETFQVRVIDVDLFENDLIGTNSCRLGTTCTVGQSQVTIRQTCKYGKSVDRSKITKDILVDNPNENINYILIRPDGFEIDLTFKGIILGDKPFGSKLISQQVMNFAEAKMQSCFGVDEGRLATEINEHATAYKVSWLNGKPNPIKAHANPVNVDWGDIDPKDR